MSVAAKQKNQKTALVVPGRKNGMLYYFKKDWQLYLLMLLPMLFILIFKFGSYFGLFIAFKDYKVPKDFPAVNGLEWKFFRRFLRKGILEKQCLIRCI